MNLQSIKEMYLKVIKSDDLSFKLDFIDELIKNNNNEIMNYHYDLLKEKSDKKFFQYIRSSFKKRGSEAELFLLKKIQKEKDLDLKGEVLQILGGMKCEEITPIAIELLSEPVFSLQYKAIIVLGWLGKKEEVLILDKVMNSNKNQDLRGYAASAMRQIWYNNLRLNKSILKCYYNALLGDNSYVLDSTIITCTQDILKKKFGIKESNHGDISGDISIAKPKAIMALEKFLKI